MRRVIGSVTLPTLGALLLSAVGLLVALPPATHPGPAPGAPAGGGLNPYVEPPTAVDVNPDPDIVEVFLEASEVDVSYLGGPPTASWAYNGTIPGPTIRGKQGDRLIVHFTNNLPEETTIHWHGVETPSQMDGSHISQLPVPANGGTFTYDFDLLTGSLFWYHPHIRTNEQVEKGLYGALLVRDPVEGGLDLPANERIILLDDIDLDENNQITPAIPSEPLEKVAAILNGRVGNTVLVNGQVAPVDLQVVNGEPERWRIVNVSNGRFFRMGWDSDQTIWRIGGDGGLLEERIQPQSYISNDPPPPSGDDGPDHGGGGDPTQGIFLTNGERADMTWEPFANDGNTQLVSTYDWHKGDHSVFFDPGGSGNILLGDDPLDGTDFSDPLMIVTVNGPLGPGPLYEPPETLTTIDAIDPGEVVGTMTLMMGHTPPPLPPSGDVKLFIQMKGPGQPLPFPLVTSLDARDVEVGETWIWEVVNLSHMDHPFHTHGFFFQPFEIEIQDDLFPENNEVIPIDPLENKDTFRVPARISEAPFVSRTILRAYVRFDDTGREGLVRAEGGYPAADTSGGWLTHCHIMEHSANGMMTFFETRYDDQTVWLLGTGLAGTAGIPTLRATGELLPTSPVSVDLTGAAPSATSYLFIGFSQLAAPFKQGTLVPAADLTLILTTDPTGEIHLAGTWPNGVAPGTEMWLQSWTVDGGAPAGLSASNAIKLIAP